MWIAGIVQDNTPLPRFRAISRGFDWSFPWQVIDMTKRTHSWSGSISRHRTRSAAEERAAKLNRRDIDLLSAPGESVPYTDNVDDTGPT